MYRIYRVIDGDTLNNIASRLGIDITLLRMINGLSSDKTLIPGEQIIVPVGNDNNNINDKFIKYTVEKGDNIYDIARRNNVDYKTLLVINGLNENDYIYPNQEIFIPNKNIGLYKVETNDTINTILRKTNNSIEDIIRLNRDIFLFPEQIIFYDNVK